MNESPAPAAASADAGLQESANITNAALMAYSAQDIDPSGEGFPSDDEQAPENKSDVPTKKPKKAPKRAAAEDLSDEQADEDLDVDPDGDSQENEEFTSEREDEEIDETEDDEDGEGDEEDIDATLEKLKLPKDYKAAVRKMHDSNRKVKELERKLAAAKELDGKKDAKPEEKPESNGKETAKSTRPELDFDRIGEKLEGYYNANDFKGMAKYIGAMISHEAGHIANERAEKVYADQFGKFKSEEFEPLSRDHRKVVASQARVADTAEILDSFVSEKTLTKAERKALDPKDVWAAAGKLAMGDNRTKVTHHDIEFSALKLLRELGSDEDDADDDEDQPPVRKPAPQTMDRFRRPAPSGARPTPASRPTQQENVRSRMRVPEPVSTSYPT